MSYKIGSSTRSDIVSKSLKEMPGPGNYDQFGNFGSKTATGCFTIGEKTTYTFKNENPGPGSYADAQAITKFKGQSLKFGSSQRQGIVKEAKEGQEVPGPGNYDNLQEFGKGAKGISIRGKRNEMRIADHPGPGSYE